MAKQIYCIRVEHEILVMADSPKQAVEIADTERAFQDLYDPFSVDDMDVEVATHVPSGFEKDELIYHEGNFDLTVGEAAQQTGSKLFLPPSGSTL